MVVLDTLQDTILLIASTLIPYCSGRIIKLPKKSYFWDKLVKSCDNDMDVEY